MTHRRVLVEPLLDLLVGRPGRREVLNDEAAAARLEVVVGDEEVGAAGLPEGLVLAPLGRWICVIVLVLV